MGSGSPAFRVRYKNGKWEFVDPDGQGFYSLGVNCVVCPIGSAEIDIVGKYGGGPGWLKRWADAKLNQLKNWGFNTLGAWHEFCYRGKLFPKTVEIRLSRAAKRATESWGAGFPDVFDPSFHSSVERALADCFYGVGKGLAGDPSLIGYFTDNELHWWGSGGSWGEDKPGESRTGLVDDYIALPPTAAGKKAWVEYLASKYQSIEKLNYCWESEYCSFDDLLSLSRYRARPEVLEKDKVGFLKDIAKRYFSITTEALRRYDPYHLILGCRMVGTSTPSVVFEVMRDYVDVISMNFYTFHLPEPYLRGVHDITGRPIMVSEFSFCAGRESGFPVSSNGALHVLVRDQKRRGECYRDLVSEAARIPFLVGTHWFALCDYSDPKGLIGNYGLLSLKDEPWGEFVSAVRKANHAVLSCRQRPTGVTD